MPNYNKHYDAKTQTLLIATDADEDTLLPNADVMAWSKELQAGKTQDGQPLKRIAVVFEDVGCAEYNHHALAFMRIESMVGTLSNPAKFNPDDPADFSVKEDFGI